MEYNCPMIKVYRLAAGALLIPSSVLCLINHSVIKYVGAEFANSASQLEARACCPGQKWRKKKFDPICADNISKRSESLTALTARNIKVFFSEGQASKYVKPAANHMSTKFQSISWPSLFKRSSYITSNPWGLYRKCCTSAFLRVWLAW